ncbi:MAG: hypothetical protein ACM3RP_10215 [Chitinophagales bacterium]
MAVRRTTSFLAAFALLWLGMNGPALAQPGFPLGFTASQVAAAWGGPSARFSSGPYAEEYRFTREGMAITYALRFGADERGEVTVQECYASFPDAVPLSLAVSLVPEAAELLAAPGARFTYRQLPLRSYAQDVLVHAYPAPPRGGAGEAGEVGKLPAIMFLPQGFGFAAGEVTRDLPVRGVVLYKHAPGESEVGIANPLL